MDIQANVAAVRAAIAEAARAAGRDPGEIRLVAAAKTNPAQAVQLAIRAGVDAVGENHVQEIREKLPQGAYTGVPLHMIGHLQRNKVKYVVGAVDLIESADSAGLLRAVSAQAEKLGIVQDVLLEVNIGAEAAKTGFSPAELPPALELACTLPGIRVRGLMAIPPAAAVPGENRRYFAAMYELFIDIAGKKYDNRISMDFLSMGMSGDFPFAVAEGANLVRVGSAIFGQRSYAR